MSYPEYVLNCEIINNKYISIKLENIRCLKKEHRLVSCLLPLQHINIKYEQSSVLLGSHGKFYFSLDADNCDYNKAQEWYDIILSKLN